MISLSVRINEIKIVGNVRLGPPALPRPQSTLAWERGPDPSGVGVERRAEGLISQGRGLTSTQNVCRGRRPSTWCVKVTW